MRRSIVRWKGRSLRSPKPPKRSFARVTLLPLSRSCRRPSRRRLPHPKRHHLRAGIAQVIGDTVSQFIKPKMRDQATMIQPKPAPRLPKVSTATGTSPMASPKPSPPPTPKSATGSPKPEPPALPAEAADHPMPKALPFKAPPATLTTTSPRAPPQKSSAPAAASSSEPAPKSGQEGAAYGKCSSPGNGWTSASG